MIIPLCLRKQKETPDSFLLLLVPFIWGSYASGRNALSVISEYVLIFPGGKIFVPLEFYGKQSIKAETRGGPRKRV